MSALPQDGTHFRPMLPADLAAIVAIEREIYEFPWTLGNFSDSLVAGYVCRTMELGSRLIGYGVLSLAAGEAHLLNLSVAAAWQRRGFGRALLYEFVALARAAEASVMVLEVRPSNTAARALYAASGFRQIGLRRNYYPAANGKEDALVMGFDL